MSAKARKLLEQMKRSQANWKRKDLDILYLGFGFTIKHGANHDRVKHPEFRQLHTTLPRHNQVAKIYVRVAIKLVAELRRLQEERNKTGGTNE